MPFDCDSDFDWDKGWQNLYEWLISSIAPTTIDPTTIDPTRTTSLDPTPTATVDQTLTTNLEPTTATEITPSIDSMTVDQTTAGEQASECMDCALSSPVVLRAMSEGLLKTEESLSLVEILPSRISSSNAE